MMRTTQVSRFPVSTLLLVLLGVGLCLAVLGCARSFKEGPPLSEEFDNRFWAGVRPASLDTDRLLSNARYFKLMGRPGLALKELEEAHQREPHNLKVLDALARTYEEMGEYGRAQQLYREALARDAANPALANNLCYSYYLAGNWREAEKCFRHILAQNPHNLAARNNLGMLLCRVGRGEEAHRLWQEAEGPVAAQHKLTEVLAALGQAVSPAYARATPPGPPAASVADKSPEGSANSELLASKPRPGLESSPPPASPERRPQKELKALARAVSAGQADKAPAAARAPAASPEESRAEGRDEAPAPAAPPAAAPAAPPTLALKEFEGPAAAPLDHRDQAPAPQTERPPVLTAQELTDTAVEILNGNGALHMARDTRALLSQEGFQVARIGNYRDFGAAETIIYFRPQAEKVARAINARFFQARKLEAGANLPQTVDIKVILGRDLLKRQQLLAQLTETDEEE